MKLTQRGTEDTEGEGQGWRVGRRPELFLHLAVDDPLNAIFQANGSEVEQQSDLVAAKAQIGENLLGMYRCEFFDGFQFHDDSSLDEQVGTKALFKNHFIITNRNRDLPFHAQSSLPQFMRQKDFVNRLQQAR